MNSISEAETGYVRIICPAQGGLEVKKLPNLLNFPVTGLPFGRENYLHVVIGIIFGYSLVDEPFRDSENLKRY